MQPLDFFHRANSDYLERLYAQYQGNPQSVDGQWQAFFAGIEAASIHSPRQLDSSGAQPRQPDWLDQRIYELVHSYRELGHCLAKIDPLGHDRPAHPLLALSESGLSEADLDLKIESSSFLGPPVNTLRELLAQLQATYCGPLGVEYMTITDKEQRTWLQERMERVLNRPAYSVEESRR